MKITIFLISLTLVFFLSSIFKIPSVKLGANDIKISEPKFKKLTYLLIDGLRFDGAIPVNKTGYYYNNLTFFQNEEILKTSYLSIAGIPTATTCRVLSMMTGTPSNQIQEILTFYISESKLDNLPDKFKNRKMRHYGDNLWSIAFTALKNKSDNFCGLSKLDGYKLEKNMIKKVLDDNENDIKFIHLINLDSYGHKYGTDHEMMKKEMKMLDDFIIKLYEKMDNETLLVITSDHGVTDEGAHGGTSEKELASFCGFYSKIPKKLYHNVDNKNNYHYYNSEFLSLFYNLQKINTKDDWICAKNNYKVVHQDDILPTICYYMGVPPPINTYGNIIPFLIMDPEASKILSNQKIELLKAIKCKFEIKEEKCFLEKNFKLTNLIYKVSSGYYPILAFISLIIGLLALFRIIYKNNIYKYLTISDIPFIFTTIMVSHSYYSYASEDLFWFFTLLISKFSIENLLAVLFFIKTSERSFFNEDKFDLKISKYNNFYEMLTHIFLFFIVKNVSTISKFKNIATINNFKSIDKIKNIVNFTNIKNICNFTNIKNIATIINIKNPANYTNFRNIASFPNLRNIFNNIAKTIDKIIGKIFVINYNENFMINVRNNLFQLTMSIYDHYFVMTREDKITALFLYPSIDTLFSIHFDYKIVFCVLYFFNNLKISENQSYKYILLSMIPYILNLEKNNESVDFNTFFVLDDNFGSVGNFLGFIAYFIIPRIYVHSKYSFLEFGLFFNTFQLFFCFICSWVIKGSLVYNYFFAGRLMWVSGFFVLDLIIEVVIKIIKENKTKLSK